jgi:hypothetical protein
MARSDKTAVARTTGSLAFASLRVKDGLEEAADSRIDANIDMYLVPFGGRVVRAGDER